MGKVMTKMKIWNYEDEVRAKYGYITSEDVRMKEVEALVDTGATLLVLPENLVQELGLPLSEKVSVTYADGKKGKRKLARGIVVEILGRKGEFNAVVEKDEGRILLGQVVLETLDLYPNPTKGILEPRPGHSEMPLIELYKCDINHNKIFKNGYNKYRGKL